MTRSKLTLLTMVSVVFALVSSSNAAPFEELFRIEKVTGECMVQPPSADAFINAVDGNAYPYGTKIKTGRKSSAVVVFSTDNTCRILANAVLTITKDVKDEKIKNIELGTGKVEIKLEPEFHKTNQDSLNIVTPTAICGAIGCTFSVESRNELVNEENLLMTVIICDEGEIVVNGHGFKIPMDTEDGLTISSSSDGSFIRLRNIKGMYVIQTRNAEGGTQDIETKAGSQIKIWRTRSTTGNLWITTVMVTAADGTLLKMDPTPNPITYTEEMTGEQQGEGGQSEGSSGTEGGEEPPAGGEEGSDDGEGTGEDIVLQDTVTTSTTTTTTTTLGERTLVTIRGTRASGSSRHDNTPTPTPVGKRF